MNGDYLVPALLTIITAATPLLFAALGELVTEKSGVLNLGIEGMMLVGAICGFTTVHFTGSATLACLAALLAGVRDGADICHAPPSVCSPVRWPPVWR